MALEVKGIKRVFVIEINKEKIELQDPNPDMTPEQVMDSYSSLYPHLTTATISGPKLENDNQIFEFNTTIGTKG